jgi:hypothetical protein
MCKQRSRAEDFAMTVFRRRPSKKNWFRFAMKLGLLGSDRAVLSSIGRMLREEGDAHDVLRPRERLSADLQRKRGWSHASTLFVGFALGAAVGILFAPVTGEEARNTIREKFGDMRGKVNDVAAWAGRGGPSPTTRSTGTYAE